MKDNSVDEVSERVIEIANNATSTMLDKANKHDVSGFQTSLSETSTINCRLSLTLNSTKC